MIKKLSLIRAGAVLAVALGTGHMVQTLKADRAQAVSAEMARPKNVEKVSAAADMAAIKPVASAVPALPAGAVLTKIPATPSAEPAKPTMPQVAALSGGGASLVPNEPAANPAATAAAVTKPALAPAANPTAERSCTPNLTLAAKPPAMVSVTLEAACNRSQRVVLRHAGLAVAEKLDADGALSIDLPALTARAEISVLFSDASVVRGEIEVPDVAAVRRFGVQWLADDAFQLHAMETGAGYGDVGHVSAATPVSPSGGYLLTLGNPSVDLPMMAEIYTWPNDPGLKASPIVEAAVTDKTCGRELLAETIQTGAGGTVITDLTVAMPECDALGDILVFNNLVTDEAFAAAN